MAKGKYRPHGCQQQSFRKYAEANRRIVVYDEDGVRRVLTVEQYNARQKAK